jgi:predicted nucleic acid-binding protein
VSLVIDCSIVLAHVFEDEQSTLADAAMDQIAGQRAHVPSLWRLEVANALLGAERRGRIDASRRTQLLRLLQDLPVDIDSATDQHAWSTTLQLAVQYGLTAYDAAYLELALRSGSALATLDQALIRAARVAGAALFTAPGAPAR